MKGFTLIEVIITTLILSLVAAVILPGFNNFGAGLSVKREAQQVAFAVREAQANAFAVRGFDHDNNASTPLRFNAWGIYFNKGLSDSSFSIFVDSDDGGDFDAAEVVRTITLSGGIKIEQICARLKTGNSSDDICMPGLTSLTILYQRPNPDVTLRADSTVVSDVEIVLGSSKGDLRTVVVWSSGQISVE